MQTLLIVLLVLAGVIAVVALTFLIGALYAVHAVLGKRTSSADTGHKTDKYGVDKYGVRAAWFDEHKALTQSFNITAFDGIRLSGMLIKHDEKASNVAIVCHGYGVSTRSVQPQAQLLYENGFDVLLPCMRGHVGSEGKVGMAWLDRFDVLRWVDMIIEQYGRGVRIALVGVSMGGASVVGAAGMNPPKQVKCVIDDCGFSSLREEFEETLKRRKKSSRFSLFMLNCGMKLIHGYSLYDADFVELAKNMTVPALFIHGDKDTNVPIALGKKLFDACGSQNKKFVAFEGAEHGFCYAADTQKYKSEVNALLSKIFEAEYNPEPLPEIVEPPTPEENKQESEETETKAAAPIEEENVASAETEVAAPAGEGSSPAEEEKPTTAEEETTAPEAEAPARKEEE